MAASVEVPADFAVLVAADDELILGDVPHDVITALGDLTLMREKDPRVTEDPLALDVVHLGIVDDRGGDGPVGLHVVQTLLEGLPEFVAQHAFGFLESDILFLLLEVRAYEP